MSEEKICRKCAKPQPPNRYQKGYSWGVCLECKPAKVTEKKKRGRPKAIKKVVQYVVEPDPVPEPQPEQPQEEPAQQAEAAAGTPAEKPKKAKKLKKSVRQLNVEQLRKLLNQQLPMTMRASLMVALAQKVEEPVTALRALSEINALTGIKAEDAGKMAVPLFALPKGVDVKTVAEPVIAKKAGEVA